MSEDRHDDAVELSIPAAPEWLALARTTGAAIASKWQFTYDEIADLRLAIDELCLTLIGPGRPRRLKLEYRFDGSSIEVRGSVPHALGVPTPGELDQGGHPTADAAELSERILDALVDDHGTEAHDSEQSAWLRKYRSVTVT